MLHFITIMVILFIIILSNKSFFYIITNRLSDVGSQLWMHKHRLQQLSKYRSACAGPHLIQTRATITLQRNSYITTLTKNNNNLEQVPMYTSPLTDTFGTTSSERQHINSTNTLISTLPSMLFHRLRELIITAAASFYCT